MKIKTATAIYTGGGIYIYYGQLENGNYFRTCDDWDSIEICSKDTSTDEADYQEFYDKYTIDSLTDDKYITFWNEMLSYIIDNTPKGNYCLSELEARKKEV